MRGQFERRRSFAETGQAILALVIGLAVAIVAGASLMAEQVIQHDPLVHSDEVQHFAYRALEAGINSFLSESNKNPNLLTCNSGSKPGGQCVPTDFLSWKKVGGTTATSSHGTTVVPEYYAWGDPTFCFTYRCPYNTTKTKTPVLFVRVTIYGAAGYTTAHINYFRSSIHLNAINGFLTHIFWTTHEASDPTLSTTVSTPPHCTYDWANGYKGAPTSSPAKCSEVFFGGSTQVYGPIYSNDSIYIATKPTLGPTQTADPKCLFMASPANSPTNCLTVAQERGATPPVNQTATAKAGDKSGQPLHPIPGTDSTLEQYANFDGCVYNGPTTIEFDGTDKMTVWSKDTAQRTASATKPKCPSTHTVKGTPVATNTAYVPNLTHGNGVIYVQTAATCTPGANPFDNYTAGANGPLAQWAKTPANGKYYYNWWGPHTKTPNCEADAFVSDNPHSGGVQGQLTIGSSNDVVITGTIKYTDCGKTPTTFNSTVTRPCRFNTKSTNDSLGLIAQNYIVINHPLKDTCAGVGGCRVYPVTQKQVLATACTTAALGTPAAAVCNPVPDKNTSVLTVDAAILALNHSFAVDNEDYINGGSPSGNGVGSPDGQLRIYGTIDQKWRGVVAIPGSNGYVKDYDWNSVGAVVTPPHYLAPGTASWAISSSPIFTTDTAPTFGAPQA